jgi:nucleoside 2-deoxyribosyltransferase
MGDSMKIYLAGKMNELGEWRDGLLTARRSVDKPRWHVPWPEEVGMCYPESYPQSVIRWPSAANRLVLDTHEYVGPYRSLLPNGNDKCMGTLHGSDGRGQHGWLDSDEDRDALADLIRLGVRRCDLLFAYINAPDSHGTLLEIGMAAAQGKYISLVVKDPNCETSHWDDYWLAGQLAHDHRTYDAHRWIGDKQVARSPEDEKAFLRTVLLESISRCADWKERRAKVQDFRVTVGCSFQQIMRWTSDPRVRDEARRMVQLLEGKA